MRITVWVATRDRTTWLTAAEVSALALLLTAASPSLRIWIGLPLLAHLGYRALTSLPLGQIPGRPSGAARQRRNQHLRTRVVAFLNEVRRAENYSLRADKTGAIPDEIEENLDRARKRMLVAANEVARVAGRFGLELDSRAERNRALRGF